MTAFADYTLHRLAQGAPDNDGGLLTLTSPTTIIGANIDTGSGTVPFGFSFDYDGTTYTQATAFADGWLSFSGLFGNPYNNKQFDDSSSVIGLFPWWGDLRTAATSGYVRYEQLGSGSDRYVVVEWLCYGRYNHTTGANRLLQFQVVLRETSNNIEFRYGAPSTTGSPTASDGVIGARVDTTGAVNGNLREFSEKIGTPDANGGVSTTPVELSLDWAAGADFPGDPANSLEGYAFNFHFRATAVTPPAPPTPPSSTTFRETDADAVAGALLKLFPRGVAWVWDPSRRLYKFARGLADEVARAHNKLSALIDEADPRTTTDLIEDWERVAGLPEPCDPDPSTALADRRAILHGKLAAVGGQDPSYYKGIIDTITGEDCTITEWGLTGGFYAGATAGTALYNKGTWWHTWSIAIPNTDVSYFSAGSTAGTAVATYPSTVSQAMCIIQRIRPAHTVVFFTFPDDDPLT